MKTRKMFPRCIYVALLLIGLSGCAGRKAVEYTVEVSFPPGCGGVSVPVAVELPAEMPLMEHFDGVRVEPPLLELKAREPDAYRPSVLSQRDYLARNFRAHFEKNPRGTSYLNDFLRPLFVKLSTKGPQADIPGHDLPFLNGGLFADEYGA